MKNIFIVSGAALKEARKAKKGLTQQDLAGSLGIERTTYTNWEGKESIEIDKKQMESLKKLLDVSEDMLLHVPHVTAAPQYILDHPFIKAMAEQSRYIMGRVQELEIENKRLRGDKDNK